MSDLLDGRHVPWYAVSGHHDPDAPVKLPPPVRRDARAQLTMQERAAMTRRIGAGLDQLGTAAHLLAESLRRRK